MSVAIHLLYRGDLRVEATHGPSGTGLHTDAPVDNHGRGESFSPTDLVATALGSCMSTIMGIVAERHGMDLRGMTVRVEKHMTEDPKRRIARLPSEIRVPGELDGKQRQMLQRAAEACPVHQSLDPRIERPITWHWGAPREGG